jgi:hypothetical protein
MIAQFALRISRPMRQSTRQAFCARLSFASLMPTSHNTSRKKVIVRKFDRDWVSGYLPPADFIHHANLGQSNLGRGDVGQGELRVLDLDGKVTSIRLSDVKWICYVRDFSSGDLDHPERLMAKTFPRRPRTQGLWLRARLKDNDVIEGLAQNDSSLLDGNGLFLIPPDSRSNTQRIFLPRFAITELEILAVIRAGIAKKTAMPLQEDLFKPQKP